MKYHKYATFNVQGLNSNIKKSALADDFVHHKIKVMMVQETRIKGEGVYKIKSSNGAKLHLFNSGHKSSSYGGTGFVVDENSKVTFKPVSERISVLTAKLNNIKHVFISVYAPTNETTIKDSNDTRTFYENLSDIINTIGKNDNLVIGGDFNAKTKMPNRDPTLYKIIGKYAKSTINENGEKLIELCSIHNLRITNTFFKHKPIHLTTWQSPAAYKNIIDSKTRKPRMNPYRNQIDYILVRNCNKIVRITDCKSTIDRVTISDHKPVIMNTKTVFPERKLSKPIQRLELRRLIMPEVRTQYKQSVAGKINELPQNQDIQNQWTSVANILQTSANTIIGYKKRTPKSDNPDIVMLSDMQRLVQRQIESTNDENLKHQLKTHRNRILTEIHRERKIEENMKMRTIMSHLENNQDENQRMYDAVRNINRIKPKSPLVVSSPDGQTTDEEEQTVIISDFFKKIFWKNAEPMRDVQPTPMTTPFTAPEIRKSVSKLKTNRSPGCDNIPVELIKHAPEEVYQLIADIYNRIAMEGFCPKEINNGILIPLQKPGKPKGPVTSLRPIILLSTLRKILAVAMMKRIGERIDRETPPTQAAYRRGRSTTEHVFATKTVIERTLTSKNETVYLTLLDMSKAFDTIQRKTLIEFLQETINADELHIMKKMLEVSLAVRCGNTISETFPTDTGAPQGDCASANEFTYYLAKSLSEPTPFIHDHHYFQRTITDHEIPEELQDHNYAQHNQVQHISIDMEYADDLSEISSDNNKMRRSELDKIAKLSDKGLQVNDTKTERFVISKRNDKWKKCKLLGSLLDTEEEIKRRKALAINAANNLRHFFNNKHLTIATKIRIMNTYIEPIFMYNSEIWTTNKSHELSIDAFQRRLIRKYVFDIKWPKTISNQQLYEKSKASSWRKKITLRRLKWFGKLANLAEDTPAKKALRYGMSQYKRSRGKPRTTWIAKTKEDLKNMNFTWLEAETLAKNDLNEWFKIVKQYILTYS